ncbi:MAG: hypothetical protein U9O98_11015, partial [Asgard group archaeon]|nr:hypothetical protein [Asgard group archaeon]
MKTPSGTDKSPFPGNEDHAEKRAKELADLIINFARSQPIDQFYDWLDEFLDIYDTYPLNTAIQDLLAKSLMKAIKLFGERKAFSDMLFLLDELSILFSRNKESLSLAEINARAIYHAINRLRGTWDVEGTSVLLRNLKKLHKLFTDSNEILHSLAKSYSVAINRFCSNRQNFTCDKLLFEFRVLANKHRKDAEMQYFFAQAITSTIGNLSKEGRFEELE